MQLFNPRKIKFSYLLGELFSMSFTAAIKYAMEDLSQDIMIINGLRLSDYCLK